MENEMKINKLIFTTSLLTSLTLSGLAYAQMSPIPDASSGKESPKQKSEQTPAQLSPEKAKQYNDTMQLAADSNKELRAQIHKAHEEADAIMSAEKFDKKAFLAKAAELDQLYGKMRATMNDAFVSVAEKFSQEDRKTLLKVRNEHRRQQQQPSSAN